VQDTGAIVPGDVGQAIPSRPSDAVLRVVDEIGANVGRTDLEIRFGPANITDTTIYLAEGETRPGSILFASDSSRRVEITWMDSAAKSRPATIHFNGTASAWRLPHDITLGMNLSELERLNGRPFKLMGFGWDYGGTITNWNGGKLEDLRTGKPRVFLRLSAGESPPASVTGDRELSSDNAILKSLDPIVERVVLSYEQASG
jgi:hypothetical protein